MKKYAKDDQGNLVEVFPTIGCAKYAHDVRWRDDEYYPADKEVSLIVARSRTGWVYFAVLGSGRGINCQWKDLSCWEDWYEEDWIGECVE